MTPEVQSVDEETHITEITFQPDGRVYVFGTSRELLEILAQLQPRDSRLIQLLSVTTNRENQF